MPPPAQPVTQPITAFAQTGGHLVPVTFEAQDQQVTYVQPVQQVMPQQPCYQQPQQHQQPAPQPVVRFEPPPQAQTQPVQQNNYGQYGGPGTSHLQPIQPKQPMPNYQQYMANRQPQQQQHQSQQFTPQQAQQPMRIPGPFANSYQMEGYEDPQQASCTFPAVDSMQHMTQPSPQGMPSS